MAELHAAPGEMREQHLLDEIRRDPGKARRSLPSLTFPGHRVRLAFALGLVAASGALVSGLFLAGHHASAIKPGPNPTAKKSNSGVFMNPRAAPPTMEYPLGKGFGQQVSLAAAASVLGGPVTLPDTAQVKPSDAGAVWMENSTGDGQKVVDLAISFPKQGLIVKYIQPPISDPLSNYQAAVSNSEGSLIYLNGGVPGLTTEGQLPDGSPWGFVRFVAGGSTIEVMGHPDQASLQAAAQSILDGIGS